MTINWIWILSAVGGLGIAGYIALLFLAPAIAAIIGEFFKSIIATRIGCALLALTIGFLGGGYYMHYKDDAACKAKLNKLNANWQHMVDQASQQFEQEKAKRAEAVADAVAKEQDAKDQAVAAKESEWQTKFDEWEKAHPTARCTIQEKDFQ